MSTVKLQSKKAADDYDDGDIFNMALKGSVDKDDDKGGIFDDAPYDNEDEYDWDDGADSNIFLKSIPEHQAETNIFSAIKDKVIDDENIYGGLNGAPSSGAEVLQPTEKRTSGLTEDPDYKDSYKVRSKDQKDLPSGFGEGNLPELDYASDGETVEKLNDKYLKPSSIALEQRKELKEEYPQDDSLLDNLFGDIKEKTKSAATDANFKSAEVNGEFIKIVGANAQGLRMRGRTMTKDAQAKADAMFTNLLHYYKIDKGALASFPKKIVDYIYKPTAYNTPLNPKEIYQLEQAYKVLCDGVNWKMPTTKVLPTSSGLRARLKKMIELTTGKKAVSSAIRAPRVKKAAEVVNLADSESDAEEPPSVNSGLLELIDGAEDLISEGYLTQAREILINVKKLAHQSGLGNRVNKLLRQT